MTTRQQLSILFLIGIVVLAGTLSFVNNLVVAKALREHEIQKWSKIAEGFVGRSWLALTLDSKSAGQDIVDELTAYPDITFVALTSQTGRTLASRGKPGPCGRFDKAPPNLPGTPSPDSSESSCIKIAVQKDPPYPTPFELQPSTNAVTHGTLLLAVSQTATNALINRLFLFNILASLIIATIIYIILRIITQRMTKPLESLANTMRLAGQDHADTRAQISGTVEIVEMQRAFNQMMDQLELQAMSLESEVELRTHELAQARDAAMSSARLKSQLLAVISHEMRTPLHGLLGFLQVAQEELHGGGAENSREVHQWLTKACVSGQRLLDQINQLLTYSRADSGKTTLEIGDCAPYELIEKAMDIIAPMAKKNDNLLTVDNEFRGTLKTDADKLLQIILNLMANANKFTESGRIDVSSRLESDQYCFTIEDTGCGIPEDKLGAIFEPFMQVDMSETRKHGGTGLGLAIVQQFTTVLGGRIEVKSEFGHGTQFCVRLPKEPPS